MTTSSSLPAALADDRRTDALGAAQPPAADTVALLDHRTRLALLPAAGAPAGRYLEVMSDLADRAPRDPAQPRLIALERAIMHVGRGLVADVRVEDTTVSRRHAIIALRGDGARVLDDRSANGTFVNGRRVSVAPLHDGDIVRIGRAVFRYLEIVPARRRRPLRRFPVAPARRRPAGVARRPGGVRAPAA